MAFRATSIIPEKALDDAKVLASRIKRAAELRSISIAGGANSDVVLGILDTLRESSVALNVVKAVPGIAQYAKDQESDQTYDIVAEFTALLAVIEAYEDLGRPIPRNAQIPDANSPVWLETVVTTP